jgi:tetratricopeptide (TPR) repeat protein
MGELGEEREEELGAEPAGPSPFVFVQRAAEMNRIGRHDLAEDFARRALAETPNLAEAHVQLALAHHGRGRTQEGLRLLDSARERAPGHARIHGLRALLLTQLGRYSDAEESVLEALRLDPEDAFLFRIYGQLCFKAGQLDKAEKLLRRSLEIEPEDESASALLAMILSEAKKQTPALHHGRRSLALAPDEDVGHLALGVALLRGGRPFAARRHLREALRIDPDPDAEQLFLQADRCCRIVYLPMYLWSMVVDRLPGKNIGAWVLFLVFLFGGRAVGVPELVLTIGSCLYIGLCLYSWVAEPIVRGWTKLFPPKL